MEPEAYDEAAGEPRRPAGLVVDEDRGSLPYTLIHGEALVAAAAWAMGEAGVDLVDLTVPWDALAELDRAMVLHDPLCPMTPPDFLAECARTAVVRDVVVVGTRPVTDTVRRVHEGRIGPTVDRDGLVVVCSPVAIPPSVVRALPGPPGGDFAELVAGLRGSYDVELVAAPPAARRVASEDDVRLLEALTDAR